MKRACLVYLVGILCIPLALWSVAFAEMPENILKAAESALPVFLNSIPQGDEMKYGFTDRQEFARATLGKPYQTFTIDPNLLKTDIILSNDVLTPLEEWRFPVICDDQMRALLTVVKSKGNWQAVDIGAHVLASEIDRIEKNLSLGKANKRRGILRLYQIKMDYIVFTDPAMNMEKGTFYPIQSAHSGGGKGPSKSLDTTSPSLSLEQLLPSVKERYQRKYFLKK